MKIRENVPLSELTTMRLGGPAKYVIDIEKLDDIAPAFDFVAEKNLPFYILGGGANTIAKDDGFNGVIIRNTMTGIRDVVPGERVTALEGDPQLSFAKMGEDKGRQDPLPSGPVRITALGGTDWDTVVAYTTERGLTGIEALSKIPGTAGAAPVQNIGAYGQELADTFLSAEVYDIKNKSFKTLQKSDFGFSYRRSILNSTKKGQYFVISITLELKPGTMSRPFSPPPASATSSPPSEATSFPTQLKKLPPAHFSKTSTLLRTKLKLPNPKISPSTTVTMDSKSTPAG